MEQKSDRPMETWSDDQLIEEYRYLTNDLSDSSDQDRPDVSAIAEEMQRRGLSFPAVPTEFPKSESVEWDGDDATGDPSSGAIPPV